MDEMDETVRARIELLVTWLASALDLFAACLASVTGGS